MRSASTSISREPTHGAVVTLFFHRTATGGGGSGPSVCWSGPSLSPAGPLLITRAHTRESPAPPRSQIYKTAVASGRVACTGQRNSPIPGYRFTFKLKFKMLHCHGIFE
ncbi:hypothetical protein AAFF_G00100720 [Aldrovandia affinis]|uniref:Uncharacterized protein n=1 Tax=Aldrovandia affinis TaxID=143900 RepID=A0AAD7RUQ8_9TELE|nr:hypothetical protein AAFF_G00100720 [Aldrovandia affinis]